jgi:hypothetical protein
VSVGYCQSLNFVAAVLLLVAGEEGAFWLLAALCSRVIPDYHTHQMAGLRADTPLLTELVGRTMPQLASHFADLEVPLEILGSQWFLCMYANVLPTASLLRVWDSALAGGGVEALVSAALATLRRHEARLRQTEDIAGVYAVLAEETPAMWNASALVLEMNERVSELERADRAWEKMRGEREARRREQLAQAAAGSAVAPAALEGMLGRLDEALLGVTPGEGVKPPLALRCRDQYVDATRLATLLAPLTAPPIGADAAGELFDALDQGRPRDAPPLSIADVAVALWPAADATPSEAGERARQVLEARGIALPRTVQ